MLIVSTPNATRRVVTTTLYSTPVMEILATATQPNDFNAGSTGQAAEIGIGKYIRIFIFTPVRVFTVLPPFVPLLAHTNFLNYRSRHTWCGWGAVIFQKQIHPSM